MEPSFGMDVSSFGNGGSPLSAGVSARNASCASGSLAKISHRTFSPFVRFRICGVPASRSLSRLHVKFKEMTRSQQNRGPPLSFTQKLSDFPGSAPAHRVSPAIQNLPVSGAVSSKTALPRHLSGFVVSVRKLPPAAAEVHEVSPIWN